MTVYRHFPHEPTLARACSGRHSHPTPAGGPIEDPERRPRTASTETYAYHRATEQMMSRVLADAHHHRPAVLCLGERRGFRFPCMEPPLSLEELQLTARNHGMPLEALRYPLTPVGLHYLLAHYDIPAVDASTWRLSIGGSVARPRALGLEELRARPAAEVTATMECAGNGRARLAPRAFSQPWLDEAVGTASWRGVPLRPLLEECGVGDDAVEVVFTGLDRGTENGLEQDFARSLTLAEAFREEVLLAYEVNGQPLPPQHGFPLRLLVPGWYGMANVKWLAAITVVDRPFDGMQQLMSYRLRQGASEEGTPLTRMLPRALLVPPGIADFPTRSRTVAAGPCVLEGRAWSGSGPISAVEVSTDAGETWSTARIERDVDSRWAWCRWTCDWEATPGEHELRCRARDEAGNAQPDEPIWNLGGYANNAVQRVTVTVVARHG